MNKNELSRQLDLHGSFLIVVRKKYEKKTSCAGFPKEITKMWQMSFCILKNALFQENEILKATEIQIEKQLASKLKNENENPSMVTRFSSGRFFFSNPMGCRDWRVSNNGPLALKRSTPGHGVPGSCVNVRRVSPRSAYSSVIVACTSFILHQPILQIRRSSRSLRLQPCQFASQRAREPHVCLRGRGKFLEVRCASFRPSFQVLTVVPAITIRYLWRVQAATTQGTKTAFLAWTMDTRMKGTNSF